MTNIKDNEKDNKKDTRNKDIGNNDKNIKPMPPNEFNDPYLTAHEYDGIRESDNPLPRWWLVIFYMTVAFSFYYFYQTEHLGNYNIQEEITSAMAEINQVRAANTVATQVTLTEEELAKKTEDPKILAAGKVVFIGKCAACHREDGGGLIGPNLTDKNWIHGKGERTDILTTLREGVLDKGMPTWKDLLSLEEQIQVVGFVYSLRNHPAANGKEPQGEPNQ